MKINYPMQKIIKKQWLKSNNWLIIVAIMLSFNATSCVPTGSKMGSKQFQLSNANRYKPQKQKMQNKTQQQKVDDNEIIDDPQIKDILEFERKLNSSTASNNNSKNKAKETNKNRNSEFENDKYLELKRHQEIMSEEFNEHIYNIKEELLEVKRILSDVAADKIKPEAARIKHISADAENENFGTQSSIRTEEDDLLNKTFIIQSEEDKRAKIQKEEVAKSKSSTSPQGVNKNFNIIKQNDSQQPPNNKKQNTQKATNTNNSAINNTSNSADNNFSEVISKVAKGDYSGATKILNDRLKHTKDPAVISNCNYWLGEISFNQRDYAKSIAYFDSALTDNCDKKDVALARIAEAYLRVGKNEEAKIVYQNLLKEHPKSTHSPKAKRMLQQL